jgi:hypothetical protein
MLFVNSLTIISITAAELCIATDCTLTKSEIIYVYKPSEGFEIDKKRLTTKQAMFSGLFPWLSK